MRIGDDLLYQPIAAFAIGRGYSIPQRIGLDTFNFVIQVTPFFVEEAFTSVIRNCISRFGDDRLWDSRFRSEFRVRS